MSTYIFAQRQQDAQNWARERGIRPRDCHTFGTRSRWTAYRFTAEDDIVILGDLDRTWESVVRRSLAKCQQQPTVQRLPAAEHARSAQ